jgi:hypothetical protein
MLNQSFRKTAPYRLHLLFVALVRATAVPVAPVGRGVGLVHFIQACLLAELTHGTDAAVKCTAYRVGLRLSREHRDTAALVINSANAKDLILRFEQLYME